MRANLVKKSYLELRVGDIAHFHGARFEITRAELKQETDKQLIDAGHPQYMSADGKWLDGAIETGYFGPTKDWYFQGNGNATCCIEF